MQTAGKAKRRTILVAGIFVGLVFFLTLFVLPGKAVAQYPTPTPTPPPHSCSFNVGCVAPCVAPNPLKIESWTGCTCPCSDNTSDCCTFLAGTSCTTDQVPSCPKDCHPAVCTNINVAPDCASDGYNGNYDDCMDPGIYVCGWCPGTEPTPTPPPSCTCSGESTVCSGVTFDDSCGNPTCTGTKAKDCSGAGNYCLGIHYDVACGTCTGTKAKDCSGAGSVCSGTTYPDPNGCGICIGTEQPDCSDAGSVCSTLPPYDVPCGSCIPTKVCVCTPDCSGAGNYCVGTTYSAPNCPGEICPGTKQPDCSGAGSVCSGTTYDVACGTCTGTKAKDCSGAGSVCSGTTYPDPNGCGICTGTMPSYCSPSCACGCSSTDCTGGVCSPGPPCAPYCSPSCTCGCSSLSITGGVCKPEPYCSPSCTYGCSSLSCSGGVCVIPGKIRARAMVVSKPNTSCDDVKNSSTTLTGTVTHQFTPSSASQPTPKTQSGSSYVVFNNRIPGSYTINSQAPAQYILARACWTSVLDTPSSGEGLSHTLSPDDTLTWDLGYTSGVAWSQVQGGDVYASATLKSYVPVLTSPRAFILDGAGGYPGVAVYGQNYNFDSSGLTHGETWVSSKNWLVNDTVPATNFYQLMYRQFGSPAPTASGDTTLTSRLAGNADPYYYDGNLTINAPAWTIPNTDKVVVFVSGNLMINTPITITQGGFVAFIVNGNITVDPTVGTVDGIYITSPSGTFSTGTGSVRFVGTGMFIAGSFLLQRDLGDALNPTTSSELFMYNPQLLLTMPDQMKTLSVSWQEVAP